ncbi:hypothetical protein Q3G72_023439 [Acer saccharum]|nr:hypothetical protein Q3G72_023439 [Acer saccharum]
MPGCLVLGRNDGSLFSFQLGILHPTDPGFVHQLRDDSGIGRFWGLMSRGKMAGAVKDLVISEVHGKKLLFVLHSDLTLRVWDLSSRTRIFSHTMASPTLEGAESIRLWLGETNSSANIIPLAILLRHTAEVGVEIICVNSLQCNLGDRLILSLESSLQNISLEGGCIGAKLTSDKIWILKDSGLVFYNLFHANVAVASSGQGASQALQSLSHEAGLPHLAFDGCLSSAAWKLHYYQWVMQMFEQYNVSEDEESKYICLRRFVIVLYERKATKLLCDGKLPFIGLAEKIERELAWKAERSDVLAKPNPYKLLYAFEMQRHNWRRAAKYLVSMANVKWKFTGVDQAPSDLVDLLVQENLYDMGSGQWETLELYLEKYKDFHARLPIVVAETLLRTDPQIELPLWLVHMFKDGQRERSWGMTGQESSPASLFRLIRERLDEIATERLNLIEGAAERSTF